MSTNRRITRNVQFRRFDTGNGGSSVKKCKCTPATACEVHGQFEEFFKGVQMTGAGDGSSPVESSGKAPLEDLGTLSPKS